MKEMIIFAIVAFFITAWALDTGTPPKPIKVGISGVEEMKPAGTYKGDDIMGDFKMSDGYRPLLIRTEVYDDDDPKAAGNRNESDFPLSGGATRI